jgi:pimeloyl-[acyl-carrier protein] synthase
MTTSSDVNHDPWLGCNPFDNAFKNDPHSRLHELRSTHPVHLNPLGVWSLTRYADVEHILRNVKVGVRRLDGSLPFVDEAGGTRNRTFILQQDPPNHTRLRKLLSRAFTPNAIERKRPSLERIANHYLDSVASAGSMDLVSDFALPLPLDLISEMLGVPDHERMQFIELFDRSMRGMLGALYSEKEKADAWQAAEQLKGYFHDLIEHKREARADSLVDILIRAEEDGDKLTTSEIVDQCIGVLAGGFETTAGLIANGLRALISQPDQLELLIRDPTLIGAAVAECLRSESPVIFTQRVLHESVELDGQYLPEDSIVWAILAAANRDPAKFPHPDRFDIMRPDNHHLAFGAGTHYCLGSHLAHLEAEVAILHFLQRFTDFDLDLNSLSWRPSMFRSPSRMLVTFKTRSL